MEVLRKQYKALYEINAPTEEQLEQMEKLQETIKNLEDTLEYAGPMVVNMSKEQAEYIVPKGEEKFVHIRMFVGNRFDPDNGAEIAQYMIQKFNITDFKNFEKQAPRLGYKYGFLHKPEGFKSIYAKN